MEELPVHLREAADVAVECARGCKHWTCGTFPGGPRKKSACEHRSYFEELVEERDWEAMAVVEYCYEGVARRLVGHLLKSRAYN